MKPTQSKHQLEVTTPSDREIVMRRAFDAPKTLLFDAYTKPELIKRWLLGPDGWSMPVCDVDLRPGGTFHYVWRNDSNAMEFGLHGTYNEIDAPERIVHREKFDGVEMPDDALITTTFVEENGSTVVTLTCAYKSREIRDMALESGMDKGVARSYDRLEEVLFES